MANNISSAFLQPAAAAGNGISSAVNDCEDVYDSGDRSIDNLTYGYQWSSNGQGEYKITYSFATAGSVYNYADDASPFKKAFLPAQIAVAQEAMAAYAAVSELQFAYVADSPGSAGDLRWGNTTSSEVETAYAYYPSSTMRGGDIWFGSKYKTFLAPEKGGYAYHAYLHELGHALGLDHPHEGDVAAMPGEDQLKYSIMSYRSYDNAPLDGYRGDYYPTTLMLNDIQAIQYLYGVNNNYHKGNNTYSWAAGQRIFETIWDGGGVDTLSAATQMQGCFLNLNSGKWSSIGASFWNGQSYVRDCLTIAYDTVIENAVGSSYDDTILGNEYDNRLAGGAGNDALNGGAGSDTLAGGTGNDAYVVDSVSDIVSENFNEGYDTVTVKIATAGSNYVLPANIEAATVSVYVEGAIHVTGNAQGNAMTGNYYANTLSGDAGNDTLSGGEGDDTLGGDNGSDKLNGGYGNDTLNGGAGNDVLNGGFDVDAMSGGSGNDTYMADSLYDAISENADEGDDLVNVTILPYYWNAGDYFLLSDNVENVTITTTAAVNVNGNDLGNILTGNAAANILNGAAGNDKLRGGEGKDTLGGDDGDDTLDGGIGNDTLTGGAGDDVMAGGAGSDTYYVDDAGDKVYETTATGTDATGFDAVVATVDWTLGAYVEKLTLTGQAINGKGNALNNVITGNDSANVLRGGGGSDTLIGGLGDDTYYVDAAGDVVTEGDGGGNDTVYSTVTLALGSVNLENLVLLGTAAIDGFGNAIDNAITGNDAANTLAGGGGNDVLDGMGGSDTLKGGLGSDTLTGGAGADKFVFNTAYDGSANVDTIADFVHGVDKIYLENAVFTKLTLPVGLSASALGAGKFHSGAGADGWAAADANDFILYDTSSGDLYYDADGNGATAAFKIATLTGQPSITAEDFAVI